MRGGGDVYAKIIGNLYFGKRQKVIITGKKNEVNEKKREKKKRKKLNCPEGGRTPDP